jgi:two-component system sensor histidine kinase CpxA
MFAFVIVVSVTFMSQRIIGIGEPGIPTIPKFTLARSEIVRHQGQVALHALLTKGPSEAATGLEPIEHSGFHVWLVTANACVGTGPLPSSVVGTAREFYGQGASVKFAFPYQMRLIQSDGQSAALVLQVPGLSSPFGLGLRLFFLIGIPVALVLFLARKLSHPIEEIELAARRFSQGELSYRAGAIRGPREVRELGKAFDEMATRVESTLEAQNRLLADVSHEVRSPLGRIRLAANMLSEGKGDLQTNLGRIDRDVKRLDELIETLSTVTLPNQAIPMADVVDLRVLVEEIVDSVSLEAMAKRIELKTELVTIESTVNRFLIYSAFENLIRNAILHAFPDSVVEIRLSVGPTELRVLDRGPGVPPAELYRIFEPFYRSSEARERETGGAGLGLAIVHKAAQVHDAKSWAQLREGGGLEVVFQLK